MLEGKLIIIIPSLGHQNKGKSSFTGSGLFVLMSQCENHNELALQLGRLCTTWSFVAKGLLHQTHSEHYQEEQQEFSKDERQQNESLKTCYMWPFLGKRGLTKFVLSRFSAQCILKRWNAFRNILNAFWNVCNIPQRKLKTFHTIEKSFQNIQKTFTNVD